MFNLRLEEYFYHLSYTTSKLIHVEVYLLFHFYNLIISHSFLCKKMHSLRYNKWGHSNLGK